MQRALFYLSVFLLLTGIIGVTTSVHLQLFQGFIILGFLLGSVLFYKRITNLDKTIRGRAFLWNLNTLVYILTILAIVVSINYLASRHPWRHDFTQNNRYTLSQKTQKILNTLKKDVTVTVFVADTDGMRYSAADLLEQYQAETQKIQFTFADLNRRPDLASQLKVSQYKTTVVEYGALKEKIRGSLTEKKITAALIKLTRERRKKIYFTTGHQEKMISQSGHMGYSRLKEILEEELYQVETIILDKPIPTDCDCLIIAGATMQLLQTEEIHLQNYLNQGGNLLLALDPEPAFGFTDFLKPYGLSVTQGVVFDRKGQELSDNPMVPVIVAKAQHEITEELNVMCAFPLARVIQRSTPIPDAFDVTTILRTQRDSFAKINYTSGSIKFDPDKDIYGPLSIGYAIEEKSNKNDTSEILTKKLCRMVVIGDSDFMANGTIHFQGTYLLVQNIINWLTDEKDLMGKDERNWVVNTIRLSQRQKWIVFWIIIVLLPSIILSGGLFVYLRSRG